jgi:tRNA threonylcarbamoyladenosine biosynthesis protein TsaE
MNPHMNTFHYSAKNEADTQRLGAALAEVLPAGTTVALIGTLGAGKTRLVQAIAAACGIPRESVNSPTFVLCQEHYGRRTLYHWDAYRLKDEDEFRDLGPEEYFDSDGITLVEWADRVAGALPPEYVTVRIEVTGADTRDFEISGSGPRYRRIPAELARRLGEREPPAA